MEMSEKQISRWIAGAALTFAAVLAIEVVSQRALFADGVAFLLEIIRTPGFSHWDFARQFVHYITQWPAVLAMGMGARSLTGISMLYGLGLFSVYLATLAGCAWLTPRHQRGYLLFVVAALAYTALNSSLFIISESHWAAGLFFIALFFLLFPKENSSTGRQLLAAAAAILSWRAYESFAVLGPFLTALAITRAVQLRRSPVLRRLALTLSTIAVSGVVSAGIGLYFMFFSDRTVQKVGLAHIAGDLLRDPNTVLSSLLLWLFLIYVLVPRAGSRAHRYALAGLVVAGVVGLGLGALPLFDSAFLPTRLHYPARVLNIAVPLAFGAAMLWLQRRGRLVITPYVMLPLCALLTWNAVSQTATSWQWFNYTHEVTAAVENSPKPLLPIAKTNVQASPFAWGWTLPTLSIVLSGMQSGEVRALLVDNPHPAFQPFDPTERSQWPDLQAFGITYSQRW